jgi:hypothetical protein
MFILLVDSSGKVAGTMYAYSSSKSVHGGFMSHRQSQAKIQGVQSYANAGAVSWSISKP